MNSSGRDSRPRQLLKQAFCHPRLVCPQNYPIHSLRYHLPLSVLGDTYGDAYHRAPRQKNRRLPRPGNMAAKTTPAEKQISRLLAQVPLTGAFHTGSCGRGEVHCRIHSRRSRCSRARRSSAAHAATPLQQLITASCARSTPSSQQIYELEQGLAQLQGDEAAQGLLRTRM
jgi:hypothetical protein